MLAMQFEQVNLNFFFLEVIILIMTTHIFQCFFIKENRTTGCVFLLNKLKDACFFKTFINSDVQQSPIVGHSNQPEAEYVERQPL